ncbi:MAG: dihydroneopterin aldolase [Anaerolineales bacterium]|nr:dihydroneopterin aldolase [Anaerolineales bacterium]MBP8164822.1 dihydroneopterin aldolase [Anaerolineales bacterium]
MDKVFITNLRVRGILGIHDWERVTQREIIINATLFVDTLPAAQSDDIADCVSYSDMARKIRAHVEGAARMTVEALANDLAELCLQEPKVSRVIIRVDKPGAVPEADSVGVEVERAKA